MNYYLQHDICACCGRAAGSVHIGKSSAGWCFGLHVDPNHGVNSLADWQAAWSAPNAKIVDEYDCAVAPDEMLQIVAERSWPQKEDHDPLFYQQNHAEPGPNGLLRHVIDGRHCIGHGDGTYDLIAGEFS